ncbi:MAG: MauE/DoxX family redox-associated membrane protein [Planctomycetota bacterium]
MNITLHWQNATSGFALLVRLALGYLFLTSSLPKMRQPYDFLGDVYAYEILGPKMGLLVAMMVPWAELVVGICLLGSVFVGGALLVSAGMGAMFTFALCWAIYQDLDISCGCFGAGTSQIGYKTLIRATLVTILSVCAYLWTVLKPAQ